jgi:hypothetical protein
MITAELIVLVKRKITAVENATARGVDRLAAFEIAELSGLAHKLHDAAEREYESGRNTEESRAKAARDAKAGVGQS